MDIRELKYFYTIASEGNITNAARKLHMAQPPLSRQIRQLEERLGTQLFERGNRRIQLTEAGRVLYQRAEQILQLVDNTVQEIIDLSSCVSGTLAIGTVTTSGLILLPKWIKDFHTQYPGITYQLWEGDSYQIFELLDKGIVEIGFVRGNFDQETYNSISLPDEPLVIAMNQKGYICGASPDHVRWDELIDIPLILQRRYIAVFDEQCRQAGFTPRVVCTSNELMQDLMWVKSGIGVAPMPQSAANILADSSLIYKTIAEPAIMTRTAMIWGKSRHLSAAARHFLNLFRSKCTPVK